jgi:hypothetical protein
MTCDEFLAPTVQSHSHRRASAGHQLTGQPVQLAEGIPE